MNTAVLVATAPTEDGSAASLLRVADDTVLARLVRQLRGHGVDTVHVVTREHWVSAVRDAVPDGTVHTVATLGDALAVIARAAGDGPVLVAEADAVMHGAVLGLLLEDPRIATGILVTGAARDRGLHRVRVDRSRVYAAASPHHGTDVAGDTGSLGLLKVSSHALPAPPPGATGPADGVVATLTAALLTAGTTVTAAALRGLFFQRVASQDAADTAVAAMAAVDEDTALLAAAVKEQDGFFTTFFVSPYSRYVARWAARRGLSPNQVTTASMILGVVAAAAFATGTRAGLVAGAVLLQVAFVTDCVDGQLARYTRQFSAVGAWLDSVFDRAKEYLAYAGLAAGAVRAGDDGGVWLLAAAALALQTVRHTVDFAFAASRPAPVAAAAPHTPPPADAPSAPPATPTARLGSLGVRASLYFEQRSAMKWFKRIIVLPIGERFALISLVAALAGPRAVFVSLLVWGTLAMTYTATGRILRALIA